MRAALKALSRGLPALPVAGMITLLASCGGSGSPTPTPTVTSPPQPTVTSVPSKLFTAVIGGTVRDARTSKPIGGATVIVGRGQRKTKTDSLGHYTVSFPAGVSTLVSVSKSGYTGAAGLGKLARGTSARVDFILRPKQPGKPGVPSPPILFGNK